MKKSIAGKVGIAVIAAMLGGCASSPSQTDATQDSGFLRDYSNLPPGRSVRTWVSPKLTPANYNAILLDPLVFYPEPRPNEQVSAETLQQILAYSNDTLKRSLSERFRVVDRAGPGVLRIRGAFTGIASQGEGLKPYQYVPLAFVAFHSGGFTYNPVTGELLAQRVRLGTGERLARVAGQQVITLDTVKPLLDELAAGAFPELAKYVKPK